MKRVWAWVILIILGFILLGWINNVLSFLMYRSDNSGYNLGYLIAIIGIGFLLYLGIKKMILEIRKKK